MPGRDIGESWFKQIRLGKQRRSGVDHFYLRPPPIVASHVKEYVYSMKDRNWNMRAELARVSVGRIVLHAACAVKDGRVQWHWEGIKRELVKDVNED